MITAFDWHGATPERDSRIAPDCSTAPDCTIAPALKHLVASLPQALFLLAPDLSVASVNPAGEQLVGQGASRLIGRPVQDMFVFEEPLIVERLIEREAHLVARDTLVRILDQPARPVDMMTAPVVHFPGWQMLVLQEPVGVEALTLGMAGDDDAGNAVLRAPEVLAHEIKNPLAGIRGAAQLLDRHVDQADRALTGLITREVDRIAKLIDQMQSLSRRSAEPEAECNLHEASRHAQAILAAGGVAAGGRHVAGARLIVEEEFDPSLPPISANPDQLVQVLLNLMANARDACDGVANPRVIVRTRFASGIQVRQSAGGKPLRLPIEVRISDNGSGVPAALRDHIFEPFVSSKKSGQGLGLALVQKLVREMNGRVTYDRDEAKGLTHFRLHLPIAGSAPSKRAEKK